MSPSHPTSIAVWDVPSPGVVNSSFTVKVGTKCADACQLGGQQVVGQDEKGMAVGDGTLGDTPWAGTSALYVADVKLAAPAEQGVYSWSVTFAGTESTTSHESASAQFGFRTARPPEHRVTLTVSDRDTEAPLESVQVRLGAYRARTDGRGQASIEVPNGRYDLCLSKAGYETYSKIVDATESVTILVKCVCSPNSDPDAEQVWM